MSQIKLSGIKLYAYHGCLAEEAIIGGNYVVDVEIETDLEEAANTDNLSATVDYVEVFNIVKEQMVIRSKLIEHVAKRIADELIKKFPRIDEVKVKVIKLNPPMNGDVREVAVEVSSRQ